MIAVVPWVGFRLMGKTEPVLTRAGKRLEKGLESKCPRLEEDVQMSTTIAKPFTFKFIDAGPNIRLELTNGTNETLDCIEILTVFLKDDVTPGGGPSQAHIKFESMNSIQPKAKCILAHKTWINGKPVGADQDQLNRLQVRPGQPTPYVLDISWQNAAGKTYFQRIPVGY